MKNTEDEEETKTKSNTEIKPSYFFDIGKYQSFVEEIV